MTAPMTVLADANISFRPTLPLAYTEAFNDLQFGLADKIGIAFASGFFSKSPANVMVRRQEATTRFDMALANLVGMPGWAWLRPAPRSRSRSTTGSISPEKRTHRLCTGRCTART